LVAFVVDMVVVRALHPAAVLLVAHALLLVTSVVDQTILLEIARLKL
jgi:hypothetical protein